MASDEADNEVSPYEQLEEERISLKGQLANLRGRCADLEEERNKMEEEVAENSTSHDRLLATVSKLEARNKVLVKRQASQEEEFELERREKMDNEKTLRTHVQQLEQQIHNAQSPGIQEADSPELDSDVNKESQANEENQIIAQATVISQLRTQLADMSESQLSLTEIHTALISQVHTLEHEVAERTAECYRLREENEGFEILLRERTLDGRVYDADVFGSMSDDESASERGESEINDAAMTADQGSRFDAHGKAVPATEGDKSSSRRRREGLSLAQELGNSAARNASPPSSPILQENIIDGAGKVDPCKLAGEENPAVITLRAEVKALTDANKALRLYCSKILDRILQSEAGNADEEHVLVNVSGSVNRGSAPGTAVGGKYTKTSSKGKQSIPRNRRAVTPEIFVQADTSHEMPNLEAASATNEHLREPRPTYSHQPSPQLSPVITSTPIRAESASPISRTPGGRTLRPLSIVAKKEEREKEAKKAETDHERRLRRGFSLDWRSFSGALRAGSEPSTKPDGQSPGESGPETFLSVPNIDPQDRKLDIYEEDDEDRVERERMLTTLKLMGVQNGMSNISSALPIMEESNSPKAGNTATRPSPSRTFSRFSAFFGRPSSPNNVASSSAATENSQIDKGLESWSSQAESLDNRNIGVARSTSNPGLNEIQRKEPEQPTPDVAGETLQTNTGRRTLSAAEASDVFNNVNLANTSHHRTKGGETSLSTLWSLGSEGRDM